jgi:succinate dehydrogenase/fumarate reductase flavoprotein subunit
MTNESGKIGRRDVLRVAGLGMLATATAVLPLDAKAEARWDQEADLLVVGGGAAGLCAAVTATANGDKVILVDKGPVVGGTTRKSGGAAWLPNNPRMRAAGIADAEIDCLRYMCRYAYPDRYVADHPTFGAEPVAYDLLKAFYDNASPMVEKLAAAKALDMIEFVIPGGTLAGPDYAPQLTEDKVERGRTLWPQPTADGQFGGALMISRMEATLTQNGVPILTRHRVTQLLIDGGRVVGVEADAGGKMVRLRARKGVIFATGGYSHNLELVALHQPQFYGSCAVPSATGDFIAIAAAAGARMGDLGTAWRAQVVLEEALASRFLARCVEIPPGDSMMLVNRHGVRVVDEKRNYNDRTTSHFPFDPVAIDHPNRIQFFLFDHRGIDVYGGAYPIPETVDESSVVISGRDWSELAANIQKRLDSLAPRIGAVLLASEFVDTLTQTVKRFNGFAATGQDEDFHRGRDKHEAEWLGFFSPVRKGAEAMANHSPSPTMHPFASKGPYYAILLAAGALDTSGGPLIDAQARVIGADGSPIPGLFGAGNCIASPTRGGYFGGGGTLGPALTFGYIAANSAHG